MVFVAAFVLIGAFGAPWPSWVGTLVVAVIAAFYWHLKLKSVRIKITTHRIEIDEGIISREADIIELWRVNDVAFRQSAWQRILGISTIEVHSRDKSRPELELRGLAGSKEVFEALKDAVHLSRQSRRVLGLVE